MAFSTALTWPLSQTCTEMVRASGVETVATWLIGMRCAVDVDHHRIEQMHAGAARAQPGELLLERVDGAAHAALEVLQIELAGGHGTFL